MEERIDVREEPGGRHGSVHYVSSDDYIYSKDRGRKEMVYFKCRHFERLSCGSRMKSVDGVFYKTGREHNHGPETQELRRIAAVNECVRLAGKRHGSLKKIFEEVRQRPRGCWFHYGQAIFRKTQKFGLQQEYQKKGVVYLIVKQLIALALLPENEIFQGFSDIKRKYADELSNQPQVVQDAVKLLYAYYMNYWLLEVEPVTYSVYRDHNRTNNAIECWNRWFNERVLVAHPGFFEFMKLRQDQGIAKGSNDFELEQHSRGLIEPDQQLLQAVPQEQSLTPLAAPVAPPRTRRNATRLAITATAAEPIANSTTFEPIASTSSNNRSKRRVDIDVSDSSRHL
ncbi:hypothetical protein GHT06_020178 [Daphnia sinensis]|uniref:FLYWCH-type domain-containing protein n=1 Tax=Daphnia sinensis TaxID=1820382 RepID=A0AAD5L423_9CRUS|nr:hypothetical protein GHT06_020178 [Daphnia sinensis]